MQFQGEVTGKSASHGGVRDGIGKLLNLLVYGGR